MARSHSQRLRRSDRAGREHRDRDGLALARGRVEHIAQVARYLIANDATIAAAENMITNQNR
jgi:hypothetical protein